MKLLIILATLAAYAPLAVLGNYTWPSAYDEIEDIYALQYGYHARKMAESVLPCAENGTGKQHAANWLRTAFHDMFSYNSETGTGGLDASIWFELNHEENTAGRDFRESFLDFKPLYSPRASAADLLAMSVVVLHSSCGGTTKIPYRYGRIDAGVSGPVGLPRRDDSIKTLTNKFSAAGFSNEEMIILTACGHTLGGVHPAGNGTDDHGEGHEEDEDEADHEENEDHEEEEDHEEDHDDNEELHDSFDTSPNTFDNRIAVEYVDGTTTNPLVIGANATLNSDLRVFSSDNNKTINELARSPETFESRCSKLFRRMIDSVPHEVQLSEPLEVIDIKPYITGLQLNSANQLIFGGRIRVRTTGGRRMGRDANDLLVTLKYAYRNGGWSDESIETFYSGDVYGLYGESFAWFEFETYLIQGGISKFIIEITTAATKDKTVYDNQGLGYPIADTILLQRSESCVSPEVGILDRHMTAVVLVLSRSTISSLRLDLNRFEDRAGTVVRKMRTEKIAFSRTSEKRGDYVVYKAPVVLPAKAWQTTYDIVQEGKDTPEISFMKTEACIVVDDEDD